MTTHPQAARYFTHTVSKLSKDASLGSKGDLAYTIGNLTTIKARVEKKQRVIRSADGEEVVSSHVMWTDGDVKRTDIFWFPAIANDAADDTSTLQAARSPLTVDVATDRTGTKALYEVRF